MCACVHVCVVCVSICVCAHVCMCACVCVVCVCVRVHVLNNSIQPLHVLDLMRVYCVLTGLVWLYPNWPPTWCALHIVC